jgi:SAM-dependent methyltransferase
MYNSLISVFPEKVGDSFYSVERDGKSLKVNPVKEYQSDKVRFLTQGIRDPLDDQADMVRCFDALMYFDLSFKHYCVDWLHGVLRPGGVFVCGSNDPFGTTNKYMIYRNGELGLEAVDFAFSIENLRPMNMMPYFTLYEDELDSNCLVEACAIIRSDDPYLEKFDQIADSIQAKYEICPRGDDGFLGGVDLNLPSPELVKRSHQISSDMEEHGLVDAAVEVLKGKGVNAWKNQVGHIALTPTDLTAFK